MSEMFTSNVGKPLFILRLHPHLHPIRAQFDPALPVLAQQRMPIQHHSPLLIDSLSDARQPETIHNFPPGKCPAVIAEA